MRQNLESLKRLMELVEFPNREYIVTESAERYYLQLKYFAVDAVTGEERENFTRKWNLSGHMTDSEVMNTAFKATLTSMEHETREFFKYRGRAIYGPHFDIDKLWELCGSADALEVREEDPNP